MSFPRRCGGGIVGCLSSRWRSCIRWEEGPGLVRATKTERESGAARQDSADPARTVYGASNNPGEGTWVGIFVVHLVGTSFGVY